ncbi:hypothetical protein RQM59_09235 [Flavobacteriaceae bacterium S356]|uniref:YD repeat-containing protein n=1 Tax=Asprobacillus argus TaxID=3076534 RepID=A0ABU3LG42_9FLAO|nr:hypothetical protein [Flavobacteriaceae bacterium S356]
MKKIFLFFVVIFACANLYSQNYSYVNDDKGTSHASESEDVENIQVPLYTITIDGTNVPIFLSYNNRGRKVSEVPNSVGFNWSLQAGGFVRKTINHLVDESDKGWFYNDTRGSFQPGFYNFASQAQDLFKNTDASPDVYKMSISNGEYLNFLFERKSAISGVLSPHIINSSGNFFNSSINAKFKIYNVGQNETSNYQTENDSDLKVKNTEGVNYLFRKGLKRSLPFNLKKEYVYNSLFSIDSANYKNYYLHKIDTDFNKDSIKFEYLDTKIFKFIPHSKATMRQTNSNPQTPPAPTDAIVMEGYYEDISVEDISRKEISKIITKNETVTFLYKTIDYNTDFSSLGIPGGYNIDKFKYQKIKLLDEILIHDHNGNYISGFKFFYTERQPGQDQNLYEGDFRIKYILKYGKNRKDSYVFKKFNYYGEPYYTPTISKARDVFGYPNGKFQNDQISNYLITRQQLDVDRLPNLQYLKMGMLKSITNQMGGVTEYVYKENTSGNNYYGGLIVEELNTYDNTTNLIGKIQYTYEEPEGFGLPVYDNTYPPTNTYAEGYFDARLMDYEWQTYFIKVDPQVYYNSLSYLTSFNVYSSPQAFLKNTPASDNLISANNFQTYNQQKSGSFYKKITKTRINVNTNTSDKGYTISYYRPSLTSLYLDKNIESTATFNASNIKVKEVKYNYELAFLGIIEAFEFDNVHMQANFANINLYNYVIKDAPIYKIVDVLKSTEEVDYDHSGSSTTHKKTEYTYLNESSGITENIDYNKLKVITELFNNVPFKKTENKYLSEYQNATHLDNLVNKNPIIEETNWVKNSGLWKLESAVTSTYLSDGKIKKSGTIRGNKISNTFYDENTFTPSYFDVNENLISLATEDEVEFFFDEDGNLVCEKNLVSSVSRIYQRSDEYNGLYVDAILTTTEDYNPLVKKFLKKSFENPNESNVVYFNKAFSGDYVYNGSSINLGTFPSNTLVSYWEYYNGEWNYKTISHNGGLLTINKSSSALYIDEVRVKPASSYMESYTVIPLIGFSSELNNRGDGNRIEYDLFGRTLYLLDKDYNVLKEYRKNYITIDTTN